MIDQIRMKLKIYPSNEKIFSNVKLDINSEYRTREKICRKQAIFGRNYNFKRKN